MSKKTERKQLIKELDAIKHKIFDKSLDDFIHNDECNITKGMN